MEDFQISSAAQGPEVEDQGSRLMGAVGALAGALIGAVPWFIASTFTSFFVGWLGFIIGWTSAFGYRKLNGRKSYGFAMLVVVIFSLLALILAQFASWMFVLCTDPEWQADAARYGVSVFSMAFFSLLMPENWGILLPNLGMGLFIGILGLLSVGQYVRRYTNPEAARQSTAAVLEVSAPGLELPARFTVRSGRAEAVVGAVCTVFFAGLAIFFLIIEPQWIILGFVPFILLGLYVLLAAVNTRLEVDGNHLRAKTALGKITEFEAGEISGVSMSYGRYSAVVLHGQDGRKLFRMEPGMKNAPLMMQWLREHNIPLRG